MQNKPIGNDSIPVIGQGCWGMGGRFERDETADQPLIKILEEGIDLGLTFIDTAESYGDGHSEELVAKAIIGKREKVFIATKVSANHLQGENVIRAAEGSLKRLGTDYIDLYQIHWPNPAIPMTDTLSAMEALVTEGKVRFVGVSNFTLRQIKEAQQAFHLPAIVSVQNEYNLFDRTVETSVLPYCDKEGLSFIAYTPLDRGHILNNNSLLRIAAKHQKTAAQIALSWLISHRSVVAIPKAASRTHLLENAEVLDFSLPEEDVAELNQLFNQSCVAIPTDQIKAPPIANQDFFPHPEDLAEALKKDRLLKPIRVINSKDKNAARPYELVEGALRYHAWVLAYEGKSADTGAGSR